MIDVRQDESRKQEIRKSLISDHAFCQPGEMETSLMAALLGSSVERLTISAYRLNNPICSQCHFLDYLILRFVFRIGDVRFDDTYRGLHVSTAKYC